MVSSAMDSVAQETQNPAWATRQHGNTRDVYWYSAYEELPFDWTLFAKPKNVKIDDAAMI